MLTRVFTHAHSKEREKSSIDIYGCPCHTHGSSTFNHGSKIFFIIIFLMPLDEVAHLRLTRNGQERTLRTPIVSRRKRKRQAPVCITLYVDHP